MVLLTLFLPPLEAIPLTAIPTMVVNLLQIQRADARHMVVRKYGVFGITLLVSIFLTGYFILSFPETLLLLVLGMAMVIFAVQSFAGNLAIFSGFILAGDMRHSHGLYWRIKFCLFAADCHVSVRP